MKASGAEAGGCGAQARGARLACPVDAVAASHEGSPGNLRTKYYLNLFIWFVVDFVSCPPGCYHHLS